MASGLLYLRSLEEAIFGLLFLVFVWFIMWSIHKTEMYLKEGKGSFVRYYFRYLLTAINIIGKEKALGPTKFFRITMASLAAIVGISTILVLMYYNISTAIITRELLFRYAHVFLYVSVYPLLALVLRTLASGETTTGLIERFLTFFPLKFVQLFCYMFTFLTPVGWVPIAFLSYIGTKSTALHREQIGRN